MAIKKYTCPKCGHEIEMDDDALRAVGYSIICPECQAILKVDGDYAYVPLPEEHDTPTPPVFAEAPSDAAAVEDVEAAEVEEVETPPPFHADGDEEAKSGKSALYEAAIEYIKTCNAITVPMLKKYFELTDEQAIALMDELEQDGVVGPFTGGPRTILIPHNTNFGGFFGMNRTYESDQAQKELLEQMQRAQENGEGPKVRSCGCSLPSLLFWLVLGLILAYLLH